MRKGFSLIEILIAVAIMVLMVGLYYIVANPAGQLASSRNSERTFNLWAIMNAIQQNIADQGNRQFSCSSGSLPTATSTMTSATGTGKYNIAPCLVPTYLPTLPVDPSASSSYYTSPSNYNTGYAISINASGTMITLSAPSAELGKVISVSGW